MNTILSRKITRVILAISCYATLIQTTEAAGVFFSEYIEGSGSNQAMEIFNGTSAAISINTLQINIYENGSTSPTNTIGLSGGLLAPGDVFVIANSWADTAILSVTNQTSNSLNFNGDDAITLHGSGTLLDVFGQIGTDPGYEWGTSPLSSMNNTLIRSSSILFGDTDQSNSFDPASEWDSFGLNNFSQLGSHSVSAVPVPAAVWLFGSGLIGLVGFARYKKA